MVMVYQIKDNGFLGEAREIDPAEGVGRDWTYTAPPGAGTFKWVDCAWVEAQESAPAEPSLPPPPPPELSMEEMLRRQAEAFAAEAQAALQQTEE